MSQIPQRHFPKDRLSQGLRLVYTYAQYDRELLQPDIDIEEFANQAFSSGNTGPQRRVARMGHNLKTDAIFFNFFAKCFRNKSECFRNESNIFQNKNLFI